MYDILIKNAVVVDGTGKIGYKADVGVTQDKISKIGNLARAAGRTEIDAKGKVIAPGFIDIHNHSDGYWRIFLDPQLPSLICQGITTIIGGNCGASIAPLTSGKIIESIQKWADIKQVNVDWLSMGEFADKMRNRKFGPNFGTLVGHGTLRRGVALDEMRRLDRNELDVVKKILEKSLKEGAMGFSTGLAYSHEKAAAWDELVELIEATKSHNKIYSTHLRDESDNVITALDEALDLAKETGVNLQVSHLKVMGEKNWPLMDEMLEKIDAARRSGVNVSFDVYPYTQTGSVLYVFLPGWVAEGGKKMLIKRLKDKNIRGKIIEEMREGAKYHYDDAIIAISPMSKSLAKKHISEIAKAQEISVEEALINLLIASEGRVVTIVDCLSEENVRKAIRHPLSMIASDGAGYSLEHQKSGELVHPRCFGTFPRVLKKYVREEKLLTFEEAIRKMTSFPANKFGIKKRGIIQKGYYADLIVFNPNRIGDKATVENPYQYAEGMSEVIVNGKLVMEAGKLTQEMPGEYISN
ncbi:MAG: D-aminoacylase [Parcubacteria group bacterium]|jgi:N-acyl-D-aspartate/D-glutamate deacylase